MTVATAGDVVVVCGLTAEARIAAGPGIRVIAGGGRSAALASRIDAQLDRHPDIAGLVSFGVAGGLVASVGSGTLVVADAVMTSGESLFTDDRWSAALTERLPGATTGAIAGTDAIATGAGHKARLLRETGAVAVDMESHVVARAALRRALPFVVIRAVADAHDRRLPAAALVAMREDGGLAWGAILRSIARSPGQLPALLALGAETRAAMRALGQARRAAGDRLGFTR